MAWISRIVTRITGDKDAPNTSNKFGTFRGVFIPSILTILGVIMYLRMGWVVGNVGLVGTLLIVTMSSTITFLTALSISATATNMKVGGGGAYYMISRSFGVEAGAAVGLPLFFAQALGISFYVAGFGEAVHSLLPMIPLQVISVAALVGLAALAYFSADLALKTQIVIFIIIIASLVSFFLGGPPAGGYSVPKVVPEAASFWIVFAVFFPAVTGIEAGISLSGDLKNPSRSLPTGTLAAVLVGYVTYMILPIFLNKLASAEVLRSNPLIIQQSAKIGLLVLLGVWGATLSSALGALLGAPRTLQALARDRIVPTILGRGEGKADSPQIATAVSFAIALTGVLLGDLNAIAPILSMFFLTSYGFLNLIAALEGLLENPSWRPTFRTPWTVSLLGAAACFATMFMINAGATFIAAFFCSLVFYITRVRNLNARWNDIRRSLLASLARYCIYSLSSYKNNPKSWMPNILAFVGSPTARWHLVELSDAITHGKGFLTVSTIVSKESRGDKKSANLEKSIRDYLEKRNIPALSKATVADPLFSGIHSLMRDYGLGNIRPNTFLFGHSEKNIEKYVHTLKLASDLKRNVVIVQKNADYQSPDPKKQKDIHLWALRGEDDRNTGFMLALGYMAKTSLEWQNSRLTLYTVAESEKDKQALEKNLTALMVESRLNAEISIRLTGDKTNPVPTVIGQESTQADLMFQSLRMPGDEWDVDQYSAYLRSLFNKNKTVPLCVYVFAGENINFKDIFL